tara:strand:+ start:172 stop:765 length:594 start_codon:yes stop_codon:yes gene_type:complete
MSTIQFGYARVSTDDQDTSVQRQALIEAGCDPDHIFVESASGGRWDRPELHRLLDKLRKDDVVVVWKLDRLSRSLKDLLTIMERIDEAGAGFRSLTETVDTTSAAGRMLMQMLGAFAEFEREMIRERTKAGLEAARAKGRVGGRRPKLTPEQRNEALAMLDAGRSQAHVARVFKVSASTISRLAAQRRVSPLRPTPP